MKIQSDDYQLPKGPQKPIDVKKTIKLAKEVRKILMEEFERDRHCHANYTSSKFFSDPTIQALTSGYECFD